MKPTLPHVVRYRPPTGENDWSEMSYGAAVPLDARVEERTRRVSTPGGVDVTISTIVFVPASPEIVVGGQINVVDSAEENYRQIRTRESVPDLAGRMVGWRLYCGRPSGEGSS